MGLEEDISRRHSIQVVSWLLLTPPVQVPVRESTGRMESYERRGLVRSVAMQSPGQTECGERPAIITEISCVKERPDILYWDSR